MDGRLAIPEAPNQDHTTDRDGGKKSHISPCSYPKVFETDNLERPLLRRLRSLFWFGLYLYLSRLGGGVAPALCCWCALSYGRVGVDTRENRSWRRKGSAAAWDSGRNTSSKLRCHSQRKTLAESTVKKRNNTVIAATSPRWANHLSPFQIPLSRLTA